MLVPPPRPDRWPTAAKAWWGLFVLTLALVAATIDRSIVALLVQPIKADMHLSDTQISVLIGFAFVFFYAFLGLPIARLADTRSRRLIIGLGIAFWSLATASCGLAQGYWSLFWSRVGVGAGEASFAPASYSLITDSFPPDRLPRAMAYNSLGFVVGTGLASLAGGAVIAAAVAFGPVVLPVVGAIKPWQMVFVAIGLPGLVLALMMRTVEEPTRKGLLARDADGMLPPTLSVGGVLAYLRDEGATFGPIFVSMAVKVLLSFGAALWTPALFIRTWGWSASRVAVAIGVISLVAAPAGIWFGTWLAERLDRQGRHDAYMRVVLWATLGILPFATLYPLMPTPTLALVLYAANLFAASAGIAPGGAALQVVTPAEIRSQVRAIYQFVFNIVGYAMGPLIVALFTDYLFGGDAYLRYSLALMSAILAPVAIAVTWWGLKPYGRSHAAAMARLGAAGR